MTKLEERIKKKLKDFTHSISVDFPKKNLLIEVTNACNNKCIFCANRLMDRKKSLIDPELVEKVLVESYELWMKEVWFYVGWEPLLNPNLEKYIKRASNLWYQYIYLTSNWILGSLDRIKKLHESWLNSLKFSINSISESDYLFIHWTDSHNIVLNNLIDIYQWKKENNIKMNLFVSFVATRYTLTNKDEVKNFFADKCDEVFIVNAKNQWWFSPAIEDNLSTWANDDDFTLPCSYPFNSVVVTSEWYLSACCMDFQNYLCYANLKEESISKAWNNSHIQKLRKMHLEWSVKGTLCQNCIYNSKDDPIPLKHELATKTDYQKFVKDQDMLNRISRVKDKFIKKNIFMW